MTEKNAFGHTSISQIYVQVRYPAHHVAIEVALEVEPMSAAAARAPGAPGIPGSSTVPNTTLAVSLPRPR